MPGVVQVCGEEVRLWPLQPAFACLEIWHVMEAAVLGTGWRVQGAGWRLGDRGQGVNSVSLSRAGPPSHVPAPPGRRNRGRVEPSPALTLTLLSILLEWRGLRVYCDSSLRGVPGDHFLVLELCPQPPP